MWQPIWGSFSTCHGRAWRYDARRHHDALSAVLCLFSSGFDARLKERAVLFMQSDGGLTSVGNFMGSRAIRWGPAGGVVGYVARVPGSAQACR